MKKPFKHFNLFLTTALILFLLSKLSIYQPFTLEEAKSGYTAFSIASIYKDTNSEPLGLFFRTDNNFVSTLGVYIKSLVIVVSGPTMPALRMPAIITGGVSLYILLLLSKQVFLSQKKVVLSVFLYLVSAYFVFLSLFDLGSILALTFTILALYSLFSKKDAYLYPSAVLACFSSFFAIPTAVGILIYRKSKMSLGLAAIILFVLVTNGPLFNYLLRNSTIYSTLPKNYSYKIERNISYALAGNSPLIRDSVNLTRLGHNKIHYTTRELSLSMASIIDYESLTSQGKAGAILATENVYHGPLHRFYFWELALVIAGIVFLIRNKKTNSSKNINNIGVISALPILFFGAKGLFLLLPFIYLVQSNILVGLFTQTHHRQRTRVVITAVAILYGLAYANLLYTLQSKTLWQQWVRPNDYAQWITWQNIPEADVDTEITMTDRFGEPVFYYSLYTKLNPQYFLENKIESPNLVNNLIRIEKVGNISFKSFKYYESPRLANQIWIGLPGEFNKNPTDPKTLTNGVIDKRLKINNKRMELGDELWIVKTNINNE